MDDLPVEIKEIIICFCDGESLYQLRRLNRHWKTLVDQEDKRRHLFKQRLKSDINKDTLKDLVTKIYPKKNFLYSNPHLYKHLYYATLRWKYFSKNRFEFKLLPHQFSDVIDLKINGGVILVGDKCGLYVMNYLGEPHLMFYNLGPVKNIELYCKSSKVFNKNYEYDVADVMTENNVHHFYNIYVKTFNKLMDYHEKKYMKYWNGKSIELDMKGPHGEPVIKTDYYENFVMMVTEKNVFRSKDSNLFNVHRTPFDCQGARNIFLWHSNLAICAKDDSLNIFVDGKTRTIHYLGFPPISAIFYYAGWLFLGSRCGILYGYHVNFDEILFLELANFQMMVKICDTSIIKVDVMEKKTLLLVVASDEQIFLIRCKPKEKTV